MKSTTEARGGTPIDPSLRLLLEPPYSWELALHVLVLQARCPWCQLPISDLTVNADHSLSWVCSDDCSP
jgi:hypothetical protein